jgi:type IV secretory pathway TrbD component
VCPACGAPAPTRARFCPECGSSLTASPDPVAYETTERHVFGVAPPTLLLGLVLAALLCAVVLVALGHWIAGGAFLIVAACLALFFVSAARQLPEDAASRGAFDAADRARAWTGFARVSVVSWASAGKAVARLRVEQRRLRREQRRRIHELGDAVYRDDETAAASLKADARTLGARIEQTERDLQLALATANDRVNRERRAVHPTRVLADDHGRPSGDG